MSFWENFWDVIWWTLWVFIFFAYLMVLFRILADIYRDHDLNGWWKAIWTVGLIFVPFLTALLYVITRGQGMARRSMRAAENARQETETYIRDVAGAGPAAEIARAKELLDSGAITQLEFDALKAGAIARHHHRTDGHPAGRAEPQEPLAT